MTIMSSGVGIDIVEIAEIKKRLDDKFVKRVLSTSEYKKYKTISHVDRKIAFVAGRFAAKEAYTKAYGSFETEVNFSDVSIDQNSEGIPILTSKYRPKDVSQVSISHSARYATAMVILYKKDH